MSALRELTLLSLGSSCRVPVRWYFDGDSRLLVEILDKVACLYDVTLQSGFQRNANILEHIADAPSDDDIRIQV